MHARAYAALSAKKPLKPFAPPAGSLIGGLRETQEMLDFCQKHKVYSDVEVIPAAKINEAYERTVKGDVKYRFVIDAATL